MIGRSALARSVLHGLDTPTDQPFGFQAELARGKTFMRDFVADAEGSNFPGLPKFHNCISSAVELLSFPLQPWQIPSRCSRPSGRTTCSMQDRSSVTPEACCCVTTSQITANYHLARSLCTSPTEEAGCSAFTMCTLKEQLCSRWEFAWRKSLMLKLSS